MVTLLEREFVVDLPLAEAWDHLARVEEWPSWARHIRRIDLQPPGALGLQSTGVIHLVNGVRSSFRVTEFDPPRSWEWVGPILWSTVAYDHEFEPVDDGRTRLIWTVRASGPGIRTIGRLFAWAYQRNLDRAIPLLIDEMR